MLVTVIFFGKLKSVESKNMPKSLGLGKQNRIRSTVSEYWRGGRFGVLDVWMLFLREQCDASRGALAAAFSRALS